MPKQQTQQASLFGSPQEIEHDPFSPVVTNRNHVDHGILALDLATKTGWCDSVSSSVWDFTVKESEHESVRLYKLRAKLVSKLEKGNYKLVVYEQPLIYKSKKRRPNFISFEMLGILKLLCIDYRIKCIGYHASTIKKFASGDGRADKDKMVKSCIDKLGITPQDHNEADALFLYHFAIANL